MSAGPTRLRPAPNAVPHPRRSTRVLRVIVVSLLAVVAALPARGQDQPPNQPPPPAAPPPDKIKAVKDFKVELLYSVPKEKEGSWVSMCHDPRGRLIVSDQSGGLYRITPPVLGGKADDTRVEKLAIDIGDAQGLLWAFDSLYV